MIEQIYINVFLIHKSLTLQKASGSFLGSMLTEKVQKFAGLRVSHSRTQSSGKMQGLWTGTPPPGIIFPHIVLPGLAFCFQDQRSPEILPSPSRPCSPTSSIEACGVQSCGIFSQSVLPTQTHKHAKQRAQPCPIS